MYYTNHFQVEQNIKTFLRITDPETDQEYLIAKGTHYIASLVAGIAVGYGIGEKLAAAIIGGIFGGVISVYVDSPFKVKCTLTRYTWKGESSPDRSYSDGFIYGVIAKRQSNGKIYRDGFVNSSDWKNNITFQRLMYNDVYGIEVYPDYCN